MSAGRFTFFAIRWIGIAAVLAAAARLLWLFYVYLASEAVIERRYTLPSSLVHASKDAGDVAQGKHWMTVSGCFGCHGDDLKGRMIRSNSALPIWSGDLRAFAAVNTDGDLERAIRHGLTPDARPMWVMPSDTFAYMRDKDVEDVISYIRSLPPRAAPPRVIRFDWTARKAIVAGRLAPKSPKADEILSPADLGPRFDGGRYLASISCAQCHGGDLTGSGYAPDLNVAAKYTRTQFFQLLYDGRSRAGKWIPTMSPLARARFRYFHDYEVNAIYDYLLARKTLPAWTKEQRAEFNESAGKKPTAPPPK
ncbi:MAG TPA: c-type cytochrome [Rhizomicrobium sp.]|jgi:mono/diheme cytochrome c family protein